MSNHVFYGSTVDGGGGVWKWEFSPADLAKVVSFDTRLDAQGWLGDNAAKLRNAGVREAQLTHRDQNIGRAITIDQMHGQSGH